MWTFTSPANRSTSGWSKRGYNWRTVITVEQQLMDRSGYFEDVQNLPPDEM